ncbi:uncharacterized protein LOC111459230 isoform X2 [Cucurbita moschata]|uniref:Uncharacterized protein LOC111459230 isoform X2 n=1 Tax=Cucurbita moschata TaxID=3662 RepID=A0A6J1H082_CUCMO|nr:uncharacterized protein LOC111459230 isoform X2 [Cucurbita moschata]
MELEEVRRDLEYLAEKQQQRVRYYESRAIYTTLGYLAWLRFFYFAVSSNSSTLHCVHWPMVFGLSLSCSSLYLLILLPPFIKLYRTHNLLHTICNQHTHLCQRILEATNQDGEAGASTHGVEFNVRFHQVRALHNDSFSGGEIKVYTCSVCCYRFSTLCLTKEV